MSVYLTRIGSELLFREEDEHRIEEGLQRLLGDDVWILDPRPSGRTAADGAALMRCGIGDSEFDQWPAGERERSVWDDLPKAVELFEPGSHIDVIDQEDFMFLRHECRAAEDGGKAVYSSEFDPFNQEVPWGPARECAD